MKAKDLKPGDKLTVCGVGWTVTSGLDSDDEIGFITGAVAMRHYVRADDVDTMLENGATVRRDGPIVVEGLVYADNAGLGCDHGLETRGALMKAVKETGWKHGTPVKITVEKL